MPKLSLIVPSFRKDRIIREDLIRKLRVLDQIDNSELILVIDGETKKTLDVLKDFTNPKLKILKYEQNQGKGYAVRYGFKHATGDAIGFLDADFDIDPEIIIPQYNLVCEGRDIVYANRFHKDSKYEKTFIRRMYSVFLSFINRFILGEFVHDTQTGSKMFSKKFVIEYLKYAEINSITFDVEIFLLAKKLGFKKISDVAVKIYKNSESSMRFVDGLRFIIETIKLSRRF